jgi:hypothetical protein
MTRRRFWWARMCRRNVKLQALWLIPTAAKALWVLGRRWGISVTDTVNLALQICAALVEYDRQGELRIQYRARAGKPWKQITMLPGRGRTFR